MTRRRRRSSSSFRSECEAGKVDFVFWEARGGADLVGEGVAGWLVWVVVRRFGKEKGREKWNKVGRKKGPEIRTELALSCAWQ